MHYVIRNTETGRYWSARNGWAQGSPVIDYDLFTEEEQREFRLPPLGAWVRAYKCRVQEMGIRMNNQFGCSGVLTGHFTEESIRSNFRNVGSRGCNYRHITSLDGNQELIDRIKTEIRDEVSTT
jgi:hypothetical protein